jgi:hypothetical protein
MLKTNNKSYRDTINNNNYVPHRTGWTRLSKEPMLDFSVPKDEDTSIDDELDKELARCLEDEEDEIATKEITYFTMTRKKEEKGTMFEIRKMIVGEECTEADGTCYHEVSYQIPNRNENFKLGHMSAEKIIEEFFKDGRIDELSNHLYLKYEPWVDKYIDKVLAKQKRE